ncbi:MAG: FAD-dependent oxidoreductase [Pseudomonadota bacterium]
MIIIGAGQAGAQTAISLRQMRFDGRITLLGDERYPPYQRPPLSKKVMTGEMDLERTYIRSEAYYAKSSIDLQQGVQVTGIDRAARTVTCADGTILDYDYCVICTGTRARRLDLPGGDLPGVLYLRTLEDSERIK